MTPGEGIVRRAFRSALLQQPPLTERARFTAFESLRSGSIGFSRRRTTRGLTIKALQVKAISHLVKHERWFFCERRDVSGLALAFATPERNPVKVRGESNCHPFAVKSPLGFTPLWLPYHLCNW